MDINIGIDLKNLEDRLKEFSRNLAKNMAIEVREKLYEEAPFCIQTYYSTWSPEYYKRHYYNLMDNSYSKYYSNPHNTVYRGGVRLSSSKMNDIYRLDTNEVFNMGWFTGEHYHGIKGQPGIKIIDYITSPAPYELLEEKKQEILNNIEEIKQAAISKTKF